MVITSGEAVLGVAEKRGSGSTPPGVYGNPKKAKGKQWGGETRRKSGAAQEGDQAARDGWDERAAVDGGGREARGYLGRQVGRV